MSFLDRIAACNAHDLRGFRPFLVDGARIGWLRRSLIERLADMGDVFEIADDHVRLRPALTGFDDRSRALSEVVDALAAAGHIPARRGEDYGVRTAWSSPALFVLDRCAANSFGILSFGVHVNGYVPAADGMRMWIGKRAQDRLLAPGKYDNIVAGGHPHGLTLRENLVKECAEEAGIGRELALTARPVGALSYTMEVDQGLKRDVHFIYDLPLAPDVTPRNTDGEVESFHLWPIEEVAARVRDTDDFKFNVGPVIIDFLIRHGWLTPEEPDYLQLVMGLRAGPDQMRGAE